MPCHFAHTPTNSAAALWPPSAAHPWQRGVIRTGGASQLKGLWHPVPVWLGWCACVAGARLTACLSHASQVRSLASETARMTASARAAAAAGAAAAVPEIDWWVGSAAQGLAACGVWRAWQAQEPWLRGSGACVAVSPPNGPFTRAAAAAPAAAPAIPTGTHWTCVASCLRLTVTCCSSRRPLRSPACASWQPCTAAAAAAASTHRACRRCCGPSSGRQLARSAAAAGRHHHQACCWLVTPWAV